MTRAGRVRRRRSRRRPTRAARRWSGSRTPARAGVSPAGPRGRRAAGAGPCGAVISSAHNCSRNGFAVVSSVSGPTAAAGSASTRCCIRVPTAARCCSTRPSIVALKPSASRPVSGVPPHSSSAPSMSPASSRCLKRSVDRVGGQVQPVGGADPCDRVAAERRPQPCDVGLQGLVDGARWLGAQTSSTIRVTGTAAPVDSASAASTARRLAGPR